MRLLAMQFTLSSVIGCRRRGPRTAGVETAARGRELILERMTDVHLIKDSGGV